MIGTLCLLLVAACSGGGGKSAAVPLAPIMAQGATASGTAVLFIPNRSPAAAAHKRKSQFVSPSATSVGISINSGPTTYADVSSLSPLCVLVSGGRSCTIPLTVPVGSDTFTLNLYDAANGTGNLLGTGTGSTTGTLGQTFAVSVTLNPVVTAATSPVLTFMVGNAFIAGTAGTATVAFTLLDPDGNAITLASTPSFASPLQLTSSDSHVTVSPSSWTSPSQTVTLTYDGSYLVGGTVNIALKFGSSTLATATTMPTFNDAVTTLAGIARTYGFVNGPGSIAEFSDPDGVAVDANGNVYVAEYNNVVREVTPSGVVSTFAGTGAIGFGNGPAASATFGGNVVGVAVDGSGNVYASDLFNYAIRKITPGGVVSTLAGNGNPGFYNGTGGGASFGNNTGNPRYGPGGVAVDGNGNVYVADTGNDAIRKITPGGVVTTLAGTGTPGTTNGPVASATFDLPNSVAVDSSGNVYVTEVNDVREISAGGIVSTVAGSATYGFTNGPGATATFYVPHGVAVDAGGNIYVADSYNNAIRKISPLGVVSTYAGTGAAGAMNGPTATATFDSPDAVAVDNSGNVYVADFYNDVIRKITP